MSCHGQRFHCAYITLFLEKYCSRKNSPSSEGFFLTKLMIKSFYYCYPSELQISTSAYKRLLMILLWQYVSSHWRPLASFLHDFHTMLFLSDLTFLASVLQKKRQFGGKVEWCTSYLPMGGKDQIIVPIPYCLQRKSECTYIWLRMYMGPS